MSQIEYWVTGDGITQTWALPSLPYGPVQVYWNGVLVPPSTYTISGQQVTVSFLPVGGSNPDQVGFIFYTAPSPSPPGSVAGGDSLIQVSEVVNDPDLAQPFTILRSTGSWLNGVWQSVTTEIQNYGVIAEPSVRELEMIPEGDLVKGAMVFWSAQPIYGTHATNGVGGSSDILIWRGHNYRVLDVKQYQDWGFFRATATRMKAD